MAKKCRKEPNLMSAPKTKKSTKRSKPRTKTPQTNKSEEYAIKFLHSQGLNSDQIVEELSVDNSVVDNVLASYSKEQPVVTENLMIRHTAEKKSNNVSIMTSDASMLADSVSKNKQQSAARPERVFRPRG